MSSGFTSDGRVEIALQGPGLGDEWRCQFASEQEAQNYVHALNYAFSEGFTDGFSAEKVGLPWVAPGQLQSGFIN